ncbi:DUF4012 domain-containing protein [Candidatus Woesebacteria bacterium]|nr:DUF4012 domain-containing protein [Candidatus Woesebacteria bacterium]
MNTFSSNNKPVVIFFSSCSGLSLKLIDQLLANQCRVIVVTNALESWNKKGQHLKYNSDFQIFNSKSDYIESITGNYIIFISDSVEHSDESPENNDVYNADLAVGLANKLSVNSLFIFPYTAYADVNLDLVDSIVKLARQQKDLISLLFLSDLIGPRVNFSEQRLLQRIVKDLSFGSHVRLPSPNFTTSAISINEAARQIIKRLFSFGTPGESAALLSTELTSADLNTYLKRLKPDVQIVHTGENFNFQKFTNASSKEILTTNFEEVLKEAVEWFVPRYITTEVSDTGFLPIDPPAPTELQAPLPEQSPENFSEPKPLKIRINPRVVSFKIPEIPKVKFSSPKFKIKVKKKFAAVTAFIVILLISPYALMGVGGALTLFAKSQLSIGSLKSATTAVSVSKSLISLSKSEFAFFTKTPLVGGVFEGGESLARFSYNFLVTFERGFKAISLTGEMLDKILGKGSGDINYYSREISLELDAIYKELSFLEGEMESRSGVIGYFANSLLDGGELKEVREKVMYAGEFVKELPSILGEKEKKTYLVLFQNNMELRPAGGFIGSYALVNFERGKLVDIVVQDVYDADGQLKGFVEPPAPIKKYLNEPAWYLRDSNWDPNFTVSAQQAEWFLDKEIDVKVDGVIGLDLEVAKNIVEIFGKIKLVDFDQEVTASNLYDITQTEVEKDFFPGSRKKSNFLTSLARELLTEIMNIKSQDYPKVSKMLSSSLDERHIQIYLENQEAQKAVSALGWDGGLAIGVCENNCYSDVLAVAEANVGVNKANYYVSRKMSLNVGIGENLIDRILTVDLTNSATSARDKYNTYLRVIAPNDSEFLTIEISEGNESQRVVPEIVETKGRKEAGVLVEVDPQTTRSIIFRWQSRQPLDFSSAGNYKLFWRKQAGTVADPILVNVQTPVLTKEGTTSYNTTLKQDFATSVSW